MISEDEANRFRTRLWTGRVVGAFVTLAFLASAVSKLAHAPTVVEGLTRAGMPERAIIPISLLELVAKLKPIKVGLQRRMHDRMAEVGAWLRKVVLGYYQYHAVPGNMTQLRIFKLRVQAMAECSGSPQSARTDALGPFYPSLKPVDSSTPRSAPLSRCTLLRHSSFVRAVCVDALVRICAGGDP